MEFQALAYERDCILIKKLNDIKGTYVYHACRLIKQEAVVQADSNVERPIKITTRPSASRCRSCKRTVRCHMAIQAKRARLAPQWVKWALLGLTSFTYTHTWAQPPANDLPKVATATSEHPTLAHELPQESAAQGSRPAFNPSCENAFGTVPPPTRLLADSHISADAERIDITANHARYQEESYLLLEGQVEIHSQDFQIQGQEASIDQRSGRISLEGEVAITGPGISFEGQRADIDTQANTLDIEKAAFLVHEREIRGNAQRIQGRSDSHLEITDGHYTTCPPEARAWSFDYASIVLDQASGQGIARDARFNIYDVPVLYLPWFSFPINDQRKSGFLYPAIASSSGNSGLSLRTPYYLNAADHYDFTWTPNYVHGRGLHTELEARYLFSQAETTLALGYLDDDRQYRKDKPGKSATRWGLDLEQDWMFKTQPQWQARVDFNAVSDEDYINDLNTGLRIADTEHISRIAELSFMDNTWQATLLLQGFQTVAPDIAEADQPYQRLPEISVGNYRPLTLLRLHEHVAVQFTWQSQFAYFYRNQGEADDAEPVIGGRLHHQPSLSLPIGSSAAYIKPAISLDHADYWLENATSNHVSRSVPIFDVDAALILEKPFFSGQRRFRHRIEPRLYYLYADASSQDSLPNFDSALPDFSYTRLFSRNRFSGGDRVGDANALSVGIVNRLQNVHSGRDLVVFSLGQRYFYQTQAVTLEGQGASTRSDSLLAAELSLLPHANWAIQFGAEWDERSQTTERGHSTLTYRSEGYDTIANLSHRYTRGREEQLEVSGLAPISGSISLLGRWHLDLREHRTMATLAGIQYRSCCWSAQLMTQAFLNDEEALEHAFLFQFQLKGIGRFGANAEQIDAHIPGYLK